MKLVEQLSDGVGEILRDLQPQRSLEQVRQTFIRYDREIQRSHLEAQEQT